jgi:UDP-N-acetylglucosamine 2-epimerase
VRMAREIDELRAHLTSETIRRQALEEFLFSDGKVAELGGQSKEAFEKVYQAKVEEYNKQIQEAMAEAEKAAKEAAEARKPDIVLPKPGLVGPDGAPLGG